MVTPHDRLHKAASRLFLRGLALAVAGTILAGAAEPAAAQQADNTKPKILISYDQKTPPTDLGTIVLRPNVEQSVYLYVMNPSELIMRDLTVKLVKVLPDDSTQPLAQVPVKVLRAGKRERLVFDKKAAPALEKGKPIPWPELEGPPFRFEIWVEMPGAKDEPIEPIKMPVAVEIMSPSEYVTAANPKYNKDKKELTVEIKAQDRFFGPEAVVNLVLSPEVIAGLINKKTGGAYQQILTRAGDKGVLKAENLQFEGGDPPTHGRVYVTVDGYERAFIFKTTFTGGDLKPLADGARARIVAPRYAVPGDKCQVTIEVDHAPTAGGFVDLGFDRAGDGLYAVQKLPGFRQQLVYLAPEGPKGGLAFKTIVHDWTKELDTAEVYGPRLLRVQLSKLPPNQAETIKLVDELGNGAKADEILTQLTDEPGNPHTPLSFEKKENAVLATIVLDGTPPEGIAFVDWPETLEKGEALTLKAKGRDKESFISKVTFFMGEPVDGKMPPKAVVAKGKRVDPNKNVWEGELPLDTAKAGKFEVSVQFTNGAGLSATETVTIKLVDSKKDKKAGTIVKGKVSQGTLNPPDVAVSLLDDKGVVKGTAKTNKKGEYEIVGVPPGTYRVVALRAADSTRGQTAITVPEGKELIEGVDVQISR